VQLLIIVLVFTSTEIDWIGVSAFWGLNNPICLKFFRIRMRSKHIHFRPYIRTYRERRGKEDLDWKGEMKFPSLVRHRLFLKLVSLRRKIEQFSTRKTHTLPIPEIKGYFSLTVYYSTSIERIFNFLVQCQMSFFQLQGFFLISSVWPIDFLRFWVPARETHHFEQFQTHNRVTGNWHYTSNSKFVTIQGSVYGANLTHTSVRFTFLPVMVWAPHIWRCSIYCRQKLFLES